MIAPLARLQRPLLAGSAGGGGRVARRDFAARRRAPASRLLAWLPLLAALLLAALLLAWVRLAILRTRYQLAEVVAAETQLLARDHEATLTLQRLRDPRRLERLAEQQGFVPPRRRIVLGEGRP